MNWRRSWRASALKFVSRETLLIFNLVILLSVLVVREKFRIC